MHTHAVHIDLLHIHLVIGVLGNLAGLLNTCTLGRRELDSFIDNSMTLIMFEIKLTLYNL